MNLYWNTECLFAYVLSMATFRKSGRIEKRPQDSQNICYLDFFKNLFMYLAVPGLSCSMWDLVLWPGIEPGPPALGVWNLRHPGPPGKSLIYYYYYFKWFYFIWPYSAAWGILVPWPGIKPVSLALRVQNLNHWTARQAPIWIFIGEVCQPLFWTKGYGTILNVPEVICRKETYTTLEILLGNSLTH